MWSKSRDGAKAISLAFVLQDFQHADVRKRAQCTCVFLSHYHHSPADPSPSFHNLHHHAKTSNGVLRTGCINLSEEGFGSTACGASLRNWPVIALPVLYRKPRQYKVHDGSREAPTELQQRARLVS